MPDHRARKAFGKSMLLEQNLADHRCCRQSVTNWHHGFANSSSVSKIIETLRCPNDRSCSGSAYHSTIGAGNRDEQGQAMHALDWRRRAIEDLNAGSRVVTTPRGPIEYAELGEGPAVLALHGRPGGYDQGLLIARLLGEDLARWVVVSRPGYLRTPLEVGRTPAEQADAYRALLDELKIGQVVVLGLSGGGPSALQFALRHSDRCRGLVLISAVSRRKLLRDRVLAQTLFDSWIGRSDRLAWLLYRMIGLFAKSVEKQALATLLVLPATLRRVGLLNDLEQFGALAEEPPHGIHVPTLIVHGTADRTVPIAHAEAGVRAIPGAREVRIAGSGHNLLFARPDQIRPEFAAFLKTLRPTS
jgi:pimeloyl-ACP methyl ester carboxylesterase